jgi:hypothetical protein
MIAMRTIVPSSTWFVMLCVLLLVNPSSPPAAMAQEAAGTPLRSYVERLPAGARVKVRLKSGDAFKAILMGTSDDDVIVKPRTRHQRPERRVPFADIEFIEPEATGQGVTARVVGISVAVAAATVAGVLLLLTALYSD